MSLKKSVYETGLLEIVSVKNKSVSHDEWHLNRVLKFARQLRALYGGDDDIITAAALLHDLGRSNPHLRGRKSINKSIKASQEILEEINFPKEKLNQVLLAIKEHDQPEIRPSSIEGRILKDADFLAGFGAWGILRIALWAGETGEGVTQVLERLTDRMKKRFLSLEFPESEAWAIREIAFAELFLSFLKTPPQLIQDGFKGKYIVLEGVSGSGKNKQADILQERLKSKGYSVSRVDEPAEEYRGFREVYRSHHKKMSVDSLTNMFLLMADRHEQIQQKVLPALARGDIVISVRSFISTLVYQCDNQQAVAAAAFAHYFVPMPDIFILYDISSEVAFERIKKRETAGMFERTNFLDMHRRRYLEIYRSRLFGNRLFKINSSPPIEIVAEKTWELVSSVVHD